MRKGWMHFRPVSGTLVNLLSFSDSRLNGCGGFINKKSSNFGARTSWVIFSQTRLPVLSTPESPTEKRLAEKVKKLFLFTRCDFGSRKPASQVPTTTALCFRLFVCHSRRCCPPKGQREWGCPKRPGPEPLRRWHSMRRGTCPTYRTINYDTKLIGVVFKKSTLYDLEISWKSFCLFVITCLKLRWELQCKKNVCLSRLQVKIPVVRLLRERTTTNKYRGRNAQKIELCLSSKRWAPIRLWGNSEFSGLARRCIKSIHWPR